MNGAYVRAVHGVEFACEPDYNWRNYQRKQSRAKIYCEICFHFSGIKLEELASEIPDLADLLQQVGINLHYRTLAEDRDLKDHTSL